jgi:hypothetical protein
LRRPNAFSTMYKPAHVWFPLPHSRVSPRHWCKAVLQVCELIRESEEGVFKDSQFALVSETVYSGASECESRRLGFGTARQEMVLERWTHPTRSRRACSTRYGLRSCRGESVGVAKRPRERPPDRNSQQSNSRKFLIALRRVSPRHCCARWYAQCWMTQPLPCRAPHHLQRISLTSASWTPCVCGEEQSLRVRGRVKGARRGKAWVGTLRLSIKSVPESSMLPKRAVSFAFFWIKSPILRAVDSSSSGMFSSLGSLRAHPSPRKGEWRRVESWWREFREGCE